MKQRIGAITGGGRGPTSIFLLKKQGFAFFALDRVNKYESAVELLAR